MFENEYIDPYRYWSFAGQNALYRAMPRVRPRKELLHKLYSVDSYVRHREIKPPKSYNPYFVYERREIIQADLIDMQNLAQWNQGVNYILLVMDIFSRRAWARVGLT